MMLSDSKQFPTLTKARKAIRKGSIIVQTCVDANEIDIDVDVTSDTVTEIQVKDQFYRGNL